MIKYFKPTRISINQSLFVNKKEHIYTLRVSNDRRIMEGKSASMSFYGDRKYISKIFHQLLTEVQLPKERLNWKSIDRGRKEWRF